MVPCRRTETRSPVLRDLLCGRGPRVLGEHEVRTSSPMGKLLVVGGKPVRCMNLFTNASPMMTQYVQSIKRENLTASCLTRNVGTRSPVRRLVPSLSPCCDWDLLAFLLLVFDCVRLLDVPKVGCANGGHPSASKEIVNSFCAPIYFTEDISCSRSDPLCSIYYHIPLPYLLPTYPSSVA